MDLLRGERADKEQHTRDRDIVDRWAKDGGVSLGAEVERARAKLTNVDRAQE